MRARGVAVIFGMAFMLANGATLAQSGGQGASVTAPRPAPKPALFPTLFPHPTNNNGYEEWVQATDLIRNNANVTALNEDPQPTLAFKRRVLADPEVAQALALLRAGINKPVYSPRTNLNENTPLPELAPMRNLARLLRTQMYVAFADGRVDAAIDCLRVGLAFGYRIQTDSLIAGLFGVAINSIVLKEFSQHIDQLSAYQCDDVRRVVEDFLSAESPIGHLLALEKSYALKILEARRSDPEGLMALLKPGGGEDTQDEDPDVAAVRNHLRSHPSDVNALLQDAQSRVSAYYDQTLLNLRLPVAQRKPLALDKTVSPGSALFRAISVDPQAVLDKYTRDQTQLRILGVHALIHRYRWDHNTLPNGLAELHAPNLVKDSFTESAVVYTRDGEHYILTPQQLL